MGIISQKYLHPQLGEINIRVLKTATRFTARWKKSVLNVTIPPNLSSTYFESVLNLMMPKLLASRPSETSFYYDGFKFENDLLSFHIAVDPAMTEHRLLAKREQKGLRLYVSKEWDFNTPESNEIFAKALKQYARLFTKSVVIQEAVEIANELGLTKQVTSWAVGSGNKTLGKCSRNGKITFSCNVAMLPVVYRRLVITHELAHLTYFDHSKEFYRLWQEYAKTFDFANEIKCLKSYEFPLPK